MPKRIQRSRAKGWRSPEGAVYVGRPGRYGNPFKIGRWYAKGDVFINENPPRPHGNKYVYGEFAYGNRKPHRVYTCCDTEPRSKRFQQITTAREAVEWYRWYLAATQIEHNLQELRGKDLMCWCRLGAPCHADVLLEIANR